MSEMFVFSLLSIKWIKYKGMIGHDKDWSFKLPVPHTQTHRNAGGQTVIHFKVLQYFHVFGEVPRYRHFTPYRLGLKHPVTKKSIYWHILGAILHTQLNCVQRVYVNLNYKAIGGRRASVILLKSCMQETIYTTEMESILNHSIDKYSYNGISITKYR